MKDAATLYVFELKDGLLFGVRVGLNPNSALCPLPNHFAVIYAAFLRLPSSFSLSR